MQKTIHMNKYKKQRSGGTRPSLPAKFLPAYNNQFADKPSNFPNIKGGHQMQIPIAASYNGGRSESEFPGVLQNSSMMSILPNTQVIPSDALVFTIKIDENYGNNERVSLSSLLFLDIKRNPINILKISTVPAKYGKNIIALVDKILVKDKNAYYTADWPVPEMETLSFIIYISPENAPSYLRIWNPREDPEANVKSITILSGTQMCYQGEVPKGFGTDIPIQLEQGLVPQSFSSLMLQELFPQLAPEPGIEDKYGSYPLEKIKTIKIEILSSWVGIENENIGLNAVELFGNNNKTLKWDDIQDVHISGCKNFINIEQLFREEKHSSTYTDQFNAQVRNWKLQLPSIDIALKKPTKLTRVAIWNYNARDKSLKYGAKNVRIKFNKKLVYLGKIRMGTGSDYSSEYAILDMWLHDVNYIRHGLPAPIEPSEEEKHKTDSDNQITIPKIPSSKSIKSVDSIKREVKNNLHACRQKSIVEFKFE